MVFLSKDEMITHSVRETQKVAADFAREVLTKNYHRYAPQGLPRPPHYRGARGIDPQRLVPRRGIEKVIVVGLVGDLGAGKTTFVQGMARGSGIDPNHYVNSPTFTLINEYKGERMSLVHVDLYRIDKPIDFETLGLDEYFIPGNIVVIEWIDKMPALKNKVDFRVTMESVSEKERKISIERKMP